MSVSSIEEAAQAILEADVLLFHLGAGMSADSGLAVFVDIANSSVYKEKKLSYIDLSTASWLTEGDEEESGSQVHGDWNSVERPGCNYQDRLRNRPTQARGPNLRGWLDKKNKWSVHVQFCVFLKTRFSSQNKIPAFLFFIDLRT